MADDEPNDYEKARQERMRQNAAKLEELQVTTKCAASAASVLCAISVVSSSHALRKHERFAINTFVFLAAGEISGSKGQQRCAGAA